MCLRAFLSIAINCASSSLTLFLVWYYCQVFGCLNGKSKSFVTPSCSNYGKNKPRQRNACQLFFYCTSVALQELRSTCFFYMKVRTKIIGRVRSFRGGSISTLKQYFVGFVVFGLSRDSLQNQTSSNKCTNAYRGYI